MKEISRQSVVRDRKEHVAKERERQGLQPDDSCDDSDDCSVDRPTQDIEFHSLTLSKISLLTESLLRFVEEEREFLDNFKEKVKGMDTDGMEYITIKTVKELRHRFASPWIARNHKILPRGPASTRHRRDEWQDM